MHRPLHLVVPVALAWAACICSPARAQSFLFEDVAPGTYPGSLSVTHGSQTVTTTPEGYPNGSITVDRRDSPMLNGVVANQGLIETSNGFAPIRFSFSSPVDAITFGFEDAIGGKGGDIDGSVTIRAFNSGGSLLGTMLYDNPAYDGGTYQTLSGSFGAASYFIASTAAPPNNMDSLVYEIVDSTPGTSVVPEPGTLALLASSGLLALRRKRRR